MCNLRSGMVVALLYFVVVLSFGCTRSLKYQATEPSDFGKLKKEKKLKHH